MIKFCSICKRHIEFEPPKMNAKSAFELCGHDDRKVAQLQRDLGRKR